jgi:undecaprenyl-diphosphatase
LHCAPGVTESLVSPPLHLMLLAALGVLAAAIMVALTLRALAADRRTPWRWAQHHGGRAMVGTGRLLRALGLRSAVAIAASVAALVLFATVAEDVLEYPTLDTDERIRAFTQARRTAALDRLFHAITWLGASKVLTALVVAAALLLAWRRSRRTALLAVVGPFAASLAIIGLKQVFRRDRPEGALALDIHTYSFPSGHSSGGAASLLTIAYVLAREHLVPWWSVPVAALLVVAIGASRVYLDAHWATDVAGGWAVGSGLALAGVALYERLRARDRAHRMAEGQAPDAPATQDDAA